MVKLVEEDIAPWPDKLPEGLVVSENIPVFVRSGVIKESLNVILIGLELVSPVREGISDGIGGCLPRPSPTDLIHDCLGRSWLGKGGEFKRFSKLVRGGAYRIGDVSGGNCSVYLIELDVLVLEYGFPELPGEEWVFSDSPNVVNRLVEVNRVVLNSFKDVKVSLRKYWALIGSLNSPPELP
jgi:hypothetical protein